MSDQRSDVWKWVAGILLAIITTGGGMLIRQDLMVRKLPNREEVNALSAALDNLNKTVGGLTVELQAQRTLMDAFGLTEQEIARRIRELEGMRTPGGP